MSKRVFFRKGIAFLSAICLTFGVQAQERRNLVKPFVTKDLPASISGSSGLVFIDHKLYTHNDHRDCKLYQIDTIDAHILREINLPNMTHRDVEDIAADSLYIYLGDFGNNASGNRTDLHILRVLKSSLNEHNPIMDTLWFTYPEQKDFTPTKANRTNFDCEAMIAVDDSLYLFTKQWSRGGTTLYALPKKPGRYVVDSLNYYAVDGLITSATYNKEGMQVLLCGYSLLLQPFIVLLYDYKGHDFLSGEKHKILLDLPFHQVEAIAHHHDNCYFLSNETFRVAGKSIPARLHEVDFSEFISSLKK